MSTTTDLVNAIVEGNATEIQASLNANLLSRIAERLDAMRQEVAQGMFTEAKKKAALYPVGKEDSDVNNDGKVDSTDSYLLNRRKKVTAAIRKESVEYLDEVTKAKPTPGTYAHYKHHVTGMLNAMTDGNDMKADQHMRTLSRHYGKAYQYVVGDTLLDKSDIKPFWDEHHKKGGKLNESVESLDEGNNYKRDYYNLSSRIYNDAYDQIASKKKWQNRDYDDEFDNSVADVHHEMLKKALKTDQYKHLVPMYKRGLKGDL